MNTERGCCVCQREKEVATAADRSVSKTKKMKKEEEMRGEERKGEMSNRA